MQQKPTIYAIQYANLKNFNFTFELCSAIIILSSTTGAIHKMYVYYRRCCFKQRGMIVFFKSY